MSSVAYKQADYKSDVKPIWCPGCGDYHVLMSFGRAFAQLGLPPEQIAVISGIGCSSRIPAYTNCYGFHGVHGRSLALAAGLKVTRPDLTVVVASGDGDGYSIGGNHFLHACRRNVDMTYVVMDNHIYGMTKGQPSPTTEPEFDTALSPGGTRVRPFHPLVVALASGANFIARCFSGDPNHTADVLVEAIKHPGFSFVEILSPCVTFRPDEKAWKDQVHRGAGHRNFRSGQGGAPADDRRRLQYRHSVPRQSHAVSARRRQKRYRPVRVGKGIRAMSKSPGAPKVANLNDLLAVAYQIEIDAVDRYKLLADQMETHNNPELVKIFRDLARAEGIHGEEIRRLAGDFDVAAHAREIAKFEKSESPEEADLGSAHYMMTPWHALQLSLRRRRARARLFHLDRGNGEGPQGQGRWPANWSKRKPSTSSSCTGCCAAIPSRARTGPTISIRRCRRNNFHDSLRSCPHKRASSFHSLNL